MNQEFPNEDPHTQEVRSENTRRVIRNRWDDEDTNIEEKQVSHFLNETGDIASFETQRKVSCGCGCVGTPAGICASCHELGNSGVICEACFVRCVCGKPLGPCHAVTTRDTDGSAIVLCPSCAGAKRRSIVMRFFLSPFVRFKG